METKRGRPAKPPDERASEIVQVAVTPAERKAIEKAADGSVSKWARRVLVRAAKRSR